MTQWTQFWDMNSGGDTKEPVSQIFIEAPESEAIVIFYNRFGHNPNRVSCTCCGEDYSITQYNTLEEATSYHRGDYEQTHNEIVSLGAYIIQKDVMVIYDADIQPHERVGDVPDEGYLRN